MQSSNKTAREIYLELKANPARAKFGFGEKAILVNVDLQKAYTRTDLFKTAYETSLTIPINWPPHFVHSDGQLYGPTLPICHQVKTAAFGEPAPTHQTRYRTSHLIQNAPNSTIAWR